MRALQTWITSGARSINGDNLHLGPGTVDHEARNARLEVEPARPGRARIDHEASVRASYELSVRVPVDDHVVRVGGQKLRGSRTPELVPVAHVDEEFTSGHDQLRGEARIAGRVGISIDSLNRRDDAKLLEYFLTTNIARMEDELHPRERTVNRGAQQTVSVRYEPDYMSSRVIRHASYIIRVCHGPGFS